MAAVSMRDYELMQDYLFLRSRIFIDQSDCRLAIRPDWIPESAVNRGDITWYN